MCALATKTYYSLARSVIVHAQCHDVVVVISLCVLRLFCRTQYLIQCASDHHLINERVLMLKNVTIETCLAKDFKKVRCPVCARSS